ncbi:hypothetical protein EIB18_11335 [Caulobacter vibrioides]|uniref:hypothetical protein n=1 Tax=Caulobacter TaxID=75 RepID=UPI000BB4E6F5|nr:MULTISPECIES: hypothetical protein [Caulobacter]ATC25093.1 hypothetical protein CA608_11425 [Caulobacter vibrioides]AZH13245.1 hypothetical protein EIB18_11335 [Caulobacter vibrioides]PLR09871.1 hypothetical protein CVUC_16880 [Caulobacter vibrioides]
MAMAANSLLPLREKVSPKATDEGSRRPFNRCLAAATFFNPSSDPLRGPPSPARGEGMTAIGS